MERLSGHRRGTRGGLLLAFGAVLLLAVGVASAAPAAGIDTSYGQGGVVEVTGPDGRHSAEGAYPLNVNSFGPAADGSAYVVGSVYECAKACEDTYFLARYGSDGSKDAGFGGTGTVPLPSGSRYSVLAGEDGGALVVALVGKAIEVRRFAASGASVTEFGEGGVVRLPCAGCGASQLHLLAESEGRILVDVETSVPNDGFYERATEVRLTRLLADGAPDRSFGAAGTARLAIHGPGKPTAEITLAGDATLLGGGLGRLGLNEKVEHLYLRRVAADGRPDRRFDRNAKASLRRLAGLGKHLELVSLVQGPGGTIDVLGSGKGGSVGFFLRLRADGRLAGGFGSRGLLRPPFTPYVAVDGGRGSVFAVGSSTLRRYGGDYRAYRVLAGGGLDPAYRRGAGIEVALGGVRIGATALAEGGVMVTDNGNHYCRSGCPSTPAMVRFRG